MFKFPNGSLELMLAGFYMKVSVEGVYRLSVRPFSPHASECHVYGWLTGSRQSRVIYELPGCGLLDSRYEYDAHPKKETSEITV